MHMSKQNARSRYRHKRSLPLYNIPSANPKTPSPTPTAPIVGAGAALSVFCGATLCVGLLKGGTGAPGVPVPLKPAPPVGAEPEPVPVDCAGAAAAGEVDAGGAELGAMDEAGAEGAAVADGEAVL